MPLAMDDGSLTLAEELLLIAVDDTRGTIRSATWGSALVDEVVEAGLSGALMVELALRDRLELDQDRLAVADATPTDVAILDDALAILQRSEKPRNPGVWIRDLSRELGGIKDRLIGDLVQRGILRHEEGRILWVFSTHKYPEQDGVPEKEARERLADGLQEGARPDPRVLALIGLVDACKLVELICTPEERKAVDVRIRDLPDIPGAAGVCLSALKKFTQKYQLTIMVGAVV